MRLAWVLVLAACGTVSGSADGPPGGDGSGPMGDGPGGPPMVRGLTVTLEGNGSGRVVSAPEGIDCPGTCSATFAAEQTVTLSATPDLGSSFAGFQEPCPGLRPCQVTLIGDVQVRA